MIKSIGRYFFSLGILLFAIAGLGVTKPANAFELHNFQTGFCLAVQGATFLPVTAGTNIIVWACNGTASQQWTQGPVTANGGLGSEATTLQSEVGIGMNCRGCAISTGVIGVTGGNMVGGTPLILWTQDPLFTDPFSTAMQINNQGWSLNAFTTDANGHICYEIGNAGALSGDWVMGVLAGSAAEGAQVVIWNQGPFPPAANQLWCMY
jgi:hypothetical protein